MKKPLLAFIALTMLASSCLPLPETSADANTQNTTVSQPVLASTNATIIDLRTNPNDLSSALTRITASVQEALAANQKVIVMLGETHSVPANLIMGSFLLDHLNDAGITNTALLREQKYNFLEKSLKSLFPEKNYSEFRIRAALALLDLKKKDSARYQRLEMMAYAAKRWPQAPVSRLENFSHWLALGTDVRLIDMAKVKGHKLDTADPATARFIKEHTAIADLPENMTIPTKSPEGIRLRNLWMAEQTVRIMNENNLDVAVLQAGTTHLAGDPSEGKHYHDSLHRILTDKTKGRTRIITVFPRLDRSVRDKIDAPDARLAMNNPDTILLQGNNREKCSEKRGCSLEKEIQTLSGIFRHSALSRTPFVGNGFDYGTLRLKIEKQLKKEIRTLANRRVLLPHE